MKIRNRLSESSICYMVMFCGGGRGFFRLFRLLEFRYYILFYKVFIECFFIFISEGVCLCKR